MHGIFDIRQMVICTVEPLVSEPSLVEVRIVIGNLECNKSAATIIFRSN
jgi:hypothetical protein